MNRGNLRATIFHKEGDYAAFEKILHKALQLYQVQLLAFQLMPNHYHLVLQPLVEGEMSRFMGWVGGTYTMRYHAHYPAVYGMCTSNVTRVFQFRTTIIF